MTAGVFRAAATAIAVAALVDPPLTVDARSRARIAIVESGARDPELASHVHRQLATALGSAFELVDGVDQSAAHTVVIGGRYPEQPIAGATSTVSLDHRDSDGVRVVQAGASRSVPAATAVHVAAVMEAVNRAGTSSTLVVSSAGIEVGRVEHGWTKPRERWRAELDVIPVGRPPYVIQAHIDDSSAPNPASGIDMLVPGREEPMRVLVYEPRPSWASTFLRRALEADSRFQVASLTLASRGVAAMSTSAPRALTAAAPDEFEVVVAGGVERLRPPEIAWLERFARERGGSVVLVPDSRVDLRPFGLDRSTEQLLDKPARLQMMAPLPGIEAAETLTLVAPRGAETLARNSSGESVVVSIPSGAGRVFISGALDAWRYRAEPGAGFDRFWQSVVAGLALGTRPTVDAEADPALLRPGQTATLRVRVGRSWTGAPVTAALSDGEPIRLRPAGAADTYTGRFVAPRQRGPHTIRVSVAAGPRTASADAVVAVGDFKAAHDAAGVPLSLLSQTHDGIDVDPSQIARLRSSLVAHVPSPEAKHTIHPMQSAWWMWPFAGCLAGEWWIRRRQGMR